MPTAIKLFGLLAALMLAAGCSNAVRWESGSASSRPVHRESSPTAGKAARTSRTSRRAAHRGARPSHHVVANGDTLYSIAWRYQLDYRELARWNGRQNSTLIYSGERLRLTPPAGSAIAKQTPNRRAAAPSSAATGTASAIAWQWPAKGSVSTISSDAESKLKGVLISGRLGQKITASASGAVVYIGAGLARYGQLVIIKHSDNVFSAYAHLQRVLVKQGQRVRAGQTIATMGTVTGDNKVALRFDIRHGADSLDPIPLLPAL